MCVYVCVMNWGCVSVFVCREKCIWGASMSACFSSSYLVVFVFSFRIVKRLSRLIYFNIRRNCVCEFVQTLSLNISAGVWDQRDSGHIVSVCCSSMPCRFWATTLPFLFFCLCPCLISGCWVSNQEFRTDALPVAHRATPTSQLRHASGECRTHRRSPLWQLSFSLQIWWQSESVANGAGLLTVALLGKTSLCPDVRSLLCFMSRLPLDLLYFWLELFIFHLPPVLSSPPAIVGKYSFGVESFSFLIIREVFVKGEGHQHLCTRVK